MRSRPHVRLGRAGLRDSTCSSNVSDPRQPGSPRKYCAFLSDQRMSYPGPGSPVRRFLLRNFIYGLPDLGGVPAAHFKLARRGTLPICCQRPLWHFVEWAFICGELRSQQKRRPKPPFSSVRASYWTTISTRRFCGSRTLSPVGTSSWLSPLPMTVIACAGTPSRTRASLTALARRSDSAML